MANLSMKDLRASTLINDDPFSANKTLLFFFCQLNEQKRKRKEKNSKTKIALRILSFVLLLFTLFKFCNQYETNLGFITGIPVKEIIKHLPPILCNIYAFDFYTESYLNHT